MSGAVTFLLLAVAFSATAPILKNKLNHYCDRHWDWRKSGDA